MTGPTAAGGVPPAIRIQLLGRFVVWRHAAPLPPRAFGGRLARRLLRMLALSRGTLLSKDAVADALWPVNPPADEPGNVEVLVSRIRRAVGDRSLIETGPGGYALAADGRCWVDVEAFLAGVTRGHERLGENPVLALAEFRQALDLWQGEPLAEDAYDDWAQPHRTRLWRARLQALEGAAAAALATGDPASAAVWAREAAEQEPLRESALVLLVDALAAGGDRAAALAEFDAFRRRLADELGVDPSARARELRQSVLCGQDCAGPALPAAVQDGPPPDATGRGGYGKVPDGCRDVFALMLLLGRPAAAATVTNAAGGTLRDTLRVLDTLHRAGLVEGGPHGWAPTHPGTGHTAVGRLDPSDRARLHLLLADALERDGTDPAEAASHRAAGGDRQVAATALAAAAQAGLDCSAEDDALRLADAGLALSPRGRVRAGLLEVRGEALRRRGRLDEARTTLRQALADREGGPERSRTLARLAILEARSRDAGDGTDLVELAVAEAAHDPAARGQALAAAAVIDLMAERLDRSRRRVRQARVLLEQAGDADGAARLLYWRGMARFVAGRLDEAVTELEHLADLGYPGGEMLRLWHPRAVRGHALVLRAEPVAGLADIEQTRSWATSAGYPVIQSLCLWRRTEALVALGRLDEALDGARAALDMARRIGHAECTAGSLRGLGIAWHACGELDRAADAFRDSVRAAGAAPLFAAWGRARLALVLIEQGRLTDAEPLVKKAMHQGVPLTRHETRWAHAELLRARGDAAAAGLAARALRVARDGGYRSLVPRLAELAAA